MSTSEHWGQVSLPENQYKAYEQRIASLESTIREMEESKANFIATYKMADEWDRESALEIIVERGKRIEELHTTIRQRDSDLELERSNLHLLDVAVRKRDSRIYELEQREVQARRTIREQAAEIECRRQVIEAQRQNAMAASEEHIRLSRKCADQAALLAHLEAADAQFRPEIEKLHETCMELIGVRDEQARTLEEMYKVLKLANLKLIEHHEIRHPAARDFKDGRRPVCSASLFKRIDAALSASKPSVTE